MIDLQKTSGLPISVDDKFQLNLRPPVILSKTRRFTRSISEMRIAMLDPEAKVDSDLGYEVYGGVCLQEHESTLQDHHLTYDLTIVPPTMLGQEYNKTIGHYHANIPGTQIAHPELYEVLHGHGLFLLQKMDSEFKNLITVLAIEGEPGDKIIYPPNYGHIMVNIGDEPLIMANWLSTDYKALYEPIKERHGMALYVVKGKDGKPTFVKNENYKDQPMMRKMVIGDKLRTDFGLETGEPMYVTALRNPKILEFLSNPQKYAVQLSALSS
jgi:glucose-6-phosphate isomerase, archaeal